MTDSLWNNMLANAVLAAVYVGYKIVDRCMNSKCRYGAEGLEFDISPEEGTHDPGIEMEKIADILKSRALVHRNTSRNL